MMETTEIETKALEALLAEVSAGIDEYRNGRFGTWGDASRWMVKFTYSAEQLVVTARTYLAALDSPIGEQGVKALEWTGDDCILEASTPFKVYVINGSNGIRGNWGYDQKYYPDLPTAKAAAQADFNRRILAALSPERKEPVAWRWRWAYDEPWRYQTGKPTAPGAEFEPLYAPGQPT